MCNNINHITSYLYLLWISIWFEAQFWQFPVTHDKYALFSHSLAGSKTEVRWKSPHRVQTPSHCVALWARHKTSRNRGWTDGRGGSVLSLGVHWAREQQESCDDGNRCVACYSWVILTQDTERESLYSRDGDRSKDFSDVGHLSASPLMSAGSGSQWIEFVITDFSV